MILSKNLRNILIGSVALLAGAGLFVKHYFFSPNVPSELPEEYLYIPTGTNAEGLKTILTDKGFILNANDYQRWADWEEFKNPKAGRYKLKPNWSSRELIRFLKIGEQAPLNVTLNSAWLCSDIAAKAGKYFEQDSLAFVQVFNDSTYLDSIGYTRENFMSVFIPNTYQMFWNTDPRSFVERMLKEHKRFWTDERLAKAKALNLTPDQIYSVASIVERESNKEDERPRIAGVYLNRLARGMKLQADPTVQYALMQTDGGPMRRLFNSDYSFPHPYNTYIHDGVPPGPISMASINSIDAVLNYEKHNYLYFCAKPELSGYHAFSETYEQHLQNVAIYSAFLTQQARS